MYFFLAVLGLPCCVGFSLVAVSRLLTGGASLVAVSRLLTGGFSGCRAWALVLVADGLSCSVVCGIFPDQGSNLHLLHWQEDSLPLNHQGSPMFLYIRNVFGYHFISPGWL